MLLFETLFIIPFSLLNDDKLILSPTLMSRDLISNML